MQAVQLQLYYCDLYQTRHQVVDTPEVVIKYLVADAECCLSVSYIDINVNKLDAYLG